jgi:PAS domain S-box-containing protein
LALANKPGGFSGGDARLATAFGELIAVAYVKNAAQEALASSEERFRTIVECSRDAILCLNENGEITYWNRGAEAVFGYTAEEIINKHVALLAPEHRRNDHPAKLEALMAGTTTGSVSLYGERTGLRKDGTEFPFDYTFSSWKAKDRIHYVSMSRDLTERKLAEAQLRRAERLETVARIAGQVAHDFNNLLGTLLSYPELIKADLPGDHPAGKLCDSMLTAAQQMAAINSDLMTLSRREHGETVNVNINELVHQAMTYLISKPSTLKVRVELGDEVFPVLGSPAQLLRVISNLISNAREAMSDNGILTISTENVVLDEGSKRDDQTEAAQFVRLSVSDTGCGISSEIRDNIFDVFFTTKRSGATVGSGLGLSIVQAVIEDHHGRLDFQSEVGAGTAFHIYLPVNHG